MSADPYIDPATGTLHNKLGITDAVALARGEADLTRAALQELAVGRVPGEYDLAHLMAFHKAIFGDLYAWAGQVRTVSIAKPGTVFAPPQFIESYAGEGARRRRRLADRLEADGRRGQHRGVTGWSPRRTGAVGPDAR